MKKCFSIVLNSVLALMGMAGLTACSSSSDSWEDNPNVIIDGDGTAGIKSEFVISIPQTVVGTRMGSAETQSAGTPEQFRGMDNITLIPYDNAPTGTTAKFADVMGLTSIQALNKPGSLNYRVFADQFVPIGTKHFLFYGKAIDNATTMDAKFKYGVLRPTGLTAEAFSTPSGVTFNLEQINTSAEEQANNSVGRNVVQLMTSLANTTTEGTAPHNAWRTATHIVLARLYKNFVGATVSSSNNLATMLTMIYVGLDRLPATDSEYALAKEIQRRIMTACTVTPIEGVPASLKDDYAGYPGNIGLPDGAARVRWDADASAFIDITANYNQGLKANITDYVYPASLWYYVSTPLKASNSVESVNYDSQTTWDNVINNVYSGANDVVGPTTLSVALTEPVQYAVGRIESKIEMGTGTFYDGNGQEVVTGNGYKLKGLLIGGQKPVTFDFSQKDGVERIIYDRAVVEGLTAKPGTTTSANHTLALQTKSNQVIYAALELENDGEDFMGFDGIIPAGGTFYLTTKLDPLTASNYNAATMNKIVMKDHVTKLIVTIKNGGTTADRNGDGIPDVYVFDPTTGLPIGVDQNGDGNPDPYDIDGDGNPDSFITDPDKGGPGWDTDGDGIVDIPILSDPATGKYPTTPNVPGGLGKATNGIPNLSSPGIELGTSVNLEWQEGLMLNPNI